MPTPPPFTITPPADFLSRHSHLPRMAQALTQAYEQRQIVSDEQLKPIGQALYAALNLGETLTQAKRARGQGALSIIIESDDANLMALPWETLYHPTLGFLGRAKGFTLSRRMPGAAVALPESERGPLRVLLFTSLPDDLTERQRLDVEAEQAAAQEALLSAERSGQVILEMPDDGRFESFQNSLTEFKPHVVYLSGHGSFAHDALSNTAEGSFLFEDARGRSQLIDEQKIVDCFQDTAVQLIVLSACLSAKQHPRFPDSGLSQRLYQHGLPHVIGIRESVFDVAGILMARVLLAEIAKQQPVAAALQVARGAIQAPLAGNTRLSHADPALLQASYGQWCLPQLLSHDLAHPLIDWNFIPLARPSVVPVDRLGEVTLTKRFLGRRRELRAWQNELRHGQRRCLLLTGAGGLGKTALAGKLVKSLLREGYLAFAFSLRKEHRWQDTVGEIERQLSPDHTARYQVFLAQPRSAAERANWLLRALLEQCPNQVVLLFDNLESAQQDQAPHALTDPDLQAWITAAHVLCEQGLTLLLTSRWRLPDWPEPEVYPLRPPVYGDFVAFARQQNLPLTAEQLPRTYEVLGGNFRALEFFAHAAKGMPINEEQAFLDALAQAEGDIQTDMALDRVVAQRSTAERDLLQRLLAYATPVPLDGVKVMAKPDLPNPAALLDELLAVSLVEQVQDNSSEPPEYQLSPLVSDWLLAHGFASPTPEQLQRAADFLLWQWNENVKITWDHRLAVHQALQAAGRNMDAGRFVLDWIVGPLNNAGLYQTLLDKWLPPVAEIDQPQIRGETLGQIGKQHLHLGDYDTALTYLQQSLAIQKEIGDKSGQGTTLNNLATTAYARGDYDTALTYLQQSLAIRQEIGDKSGQGATLNNISQIYDARGDYDTALTYLQQSLAIQKEIGDKSGQGTTLNNISQIFKARGDYDTALTYLQQSLAIRQEIGDKFGQGATLNNISQIYGARGDYATALTYLQQSLAIRQEIGDVAGLCATLFNIGHIHLQNKEVQEAVGAWVTVYQLASKMGLAQVLQALEQLAEQIGLEGGLQGWARLAEQMEE